MELWFAFLVSLSIAIVLKSLFKHSKNHSHERLPPPPPPGPPSLPFLGNTLWLLVRLSVSPLETILRSLCAKHGPVVSLRFGSSSCPSIFVSSHSLAHQALIHHGAAFSDRPPAPPTIRVAGSNQHIISFAPYGPTWRLLRRNLSSQIFHPSRRGGIASFSPLRRRVLSILLDRLESQSRLGEVVVAFHHFRHAMFRLLVSMCLGDIDDEKKLEEVMEVQLRDVVNSRRFRVLNFWPALGKLVFRNRWKEFTEMMNDRSNVLTPLIRSRTAAAPPGNLCYVDTLMGLELPEEGNRKLTEGEMVSLCSEFIVAGADTTTTALQWIMANLVKYPQIQEKLFAEVGEAVNRRNQGGRSREQEETIAVEEEDLQKMPYLKAVILEGLRRHPPGHFVVPHAVTEDIELGGFFIPKDATVNFTVAEMGWDPKVWEDPMAFKPERFVANGGSDDGGGEGGFDITGTRGIKMMPFGAGRRICPGLGVAMLHLEYFVSNLVWRFEWKGVEGEDVDFAEKEEMTVAMKNPLRAVLSPRISKTHARVA